MTQNSRGLGLRWAKRPALVLAVTGSAMGLGLAWSAPSASAQVAAHSAQAAANPNLPGYICVATFDPHAPYDRVYVIDLGHLWDIHDHVGGFIHESVFPGANGIWGDIVPQFEDQHGVINIGPVGPANWDAAGMRIWDDDCEVVEGNGETLPPGSDEEREELAHHHHHHGLPGAPEAGFGGASTGNGISVSWVAAGGGLLVISGLAGFASRRRRSTD